jgi:hypothetical protein
MRNRLDFAQYGAGTLADCRSGVNQALGMTVFGMTIADATRRANAKFVIFDLRRKAGGLI